MAGSLDDNPPVILGPTDYRFVVIEADPENFVCYLSKISQVAKSEVISRLREIADLIEASA